MYATTIWKSADLKPFFQFPCSEKLADIAATHGIVSRLYTTKLYAPSAEMLLSIPSGSKICSVVTTVSFAAMPVRVEMANCQPQPPSLKPRGMNMGAISFPMEASMLWSVATISKRQLKLCSSHSNTEAVKIIVPAFIRNALPLSHICFATFPTVGAR